MRTYLVCYFFRQGNKFGHGSCSIKYTKKPTLSLLLETMKQIIDEQKFDDASITNLVRIGDER